MVPWIHQLEKADLGLEILKKNATLYLAMEERTGKSLIALLIAEEAAVLKVLILTKKGKPLDGWNELLCEYTHNKYYKVTNYHQAEKLVDKDWDLIILDECHNYISSFPKTSGIWKAVRKLSRRKPIIYISATPNAQTPAQLYHQMALSDWSPWHTYSNYKNWHVDYGIPYDKYINGRNLQMWDRVQDERVLLCVRHLMLTETRANLGFAQEPEDRLHYVPLEDLTKEQYNRVLKDKILGTDREEILCDTSAKLRAVLHMLEGGVTKNVTLDFKNDKVVKHEDFIVLANNEKVAYIKEHWGDSEDVAIMYHYRAEKIKLESHFEHAQILQATTNAEGTDLQHTKHLVIYSQDWSTSKHTQRRCRQANRARTDPIIVHFLLVKDAISEEVYNTVAINKQNYVDSLFNKTQLGY